MLHLLVGIGLMQIHGQNYQDYHGQLLQQVQLILGYNLSGKGLALFAGIVMIYISIFGQWKPSMQTLSFILVAAPLSFIFGLGLGYCSI